ncbi:hypothetical protein D3C72_1850010 [compost metagenome]
MTYTPLILPRPLTRSRTAAISGVIGQSTETPLLLIVLVGLKWITPASWSTQLQLPGAAGSGRQRSSRMSVARWAVR